jgi:hypothetical protein
MRANSGGAAVIFMVSGLPSHRRFKEHIPSQAIFSLSMTRDGAAEIALYLYAASQHKVIS